MGRAQTAKSSLTKAILRETGVAQAIIDFRAPTMLIPKTEKDDANLRLEVARANWALPASGLVTMHSGNASGYDPESGLVYIKPSGMDYDQIKPGNLAVVRLETGEVLTPDIRPSVDLAHHLFLYKNLPEVRGIIHTHSNYATAFAAANKPVPCCLTAICDEFGGEIPCTPYIDNEGENIGRAILKYRRERTPAILLGNHGVFAWGSSPKNALKAAVMVEDVARTVWLAMQLGPVAAIPPEEAEKWYDRYQNRYGQG
ncbi:L-ribulose-5-phosphate 4-epimerase [Fimbriimonas ginsengisoli]|uniref:L-ribulose-5-phosphate 4-epimerase n=1 Tax=Fimbriimonas ginsengisoli TaxID=1005039 RepID=UPI001D0E0775|nr:L-ribulose-5-phosphate 4-epimerase [Fimbriimonas ginsengisoli]